MKVTGCDERNRGFCPFVDSVFDDGDSFEIKIGDDFLVEIFHVCFLRPKLGSAFTIGLFLVYRCNFLRSK